MNTIESYKNINENTTFNEAVSLANKYQSEYNSFVTIMDNFESVESSSLLKGVPYSLKDNYSTKGILTTASSNILRNYIPVYDSTVYKKLKEAGALLIGKTVLDEFAMGGSGTTGCSGVVRNPYDKTRQAGGSSAGSASSVALGIVPFSIGSDTGDSVRKPASFCGIVGFKPTYGRISRYGVFAYASSLDHVGIFANTVKDAAIVTDVLKGQDDKDITTLENDNINYADYLDEDVKGKKLFYIKELLDGEEDTDNYKIFMNTLEKAKELGIEVYEEHFDKKLLDCLYPTYFVISCAEATSNLANQTGIIFGSREQGSSADEIMLNSRTKGFGEFIKRRFIIGSYALQKENQEKLFLNACRVRRLVVDGINELFSKYDGLIMPAASGIAPKIEGEEEVLKEKNYGLDNHMVIGNFGGFPSITIPMGMSENLPLGINLTCPAKKDKETLNIANKLEKVIEFKGGIN